MTGNYTYDQFKHTPQSCLPALTELGTFGGSSPPKASGTLRRPRLSGTSVRLTSSAVLTPPSVELVDFFGLSAVVGGTTHTFGYTLNDKNQRVGATLPNGKNWTFEYDTLGQLSGAIFKFNELAERTLSYDYDQIGNRTQAVEDSTTTNYTSNLLNQYTAIAATGTTAEAPTYDADGNMLTNGEWAYTWNGENRLIALESATAKIEFDYDYMGRRYERRDYTKSGSEWVLNTTKHFVYSGFKLVAEYTNGVQENSYAWDVAGLDTPAFLKRDGSTYSYWSDGNKNILKLFSNTDAVAEYAYDPFGRVTSTNGALALLNPFRFSSEYHNDTTGLVEYIYREYSPLLGRWLTKDPIEEQGGVNLYGMLANIPINFIDSIGLILVAIDGTGSASIKKNKIGKSHVYRFYNESTDNNKLYIDGPGADLFVESESYNINDNYGEGYGFWESTGTITSNTGKYILNFAIDGYDATRKVGHTTLDKSQQAVGACSKSKHDQAVEYICNKWNESKTEKIYLIGHSRGGMIVNEVAITLEKKGCCDKETGERVVPIEVAFLGLYDPINMTPFFWGRKLSLNASLVVTIYASAPPNGERSRDLWNRVDSGMTWPPPKHFEQLRVAFIPGTHSALGGDPGNGDHPKGYSFNNDVIASKRADHLIRRGYAVTGGQFK